MHAVRLSFKRDDFDAPRLAAWVDDLRNQGLPCEAEWRRDGQPAAMEQATGFALRLRGRTVFEQLRRACTFYLKNVLGPEHRLVLTSARAHGVFVAPRFGGAFVCLGIYALSQLLAVSIFAEGFVHTVLPCYALLVTGHALWFSRSEKGQADPSRIPMVMTVPAMILTMPASLLNVPAFAKYRHLQWWVRAGEP